MKLVSAICFSLFISGCATGTRSPITSTVRGPATGSALPADAQRVVDKLEACNHFAGEFIGDRSARDREVNAAMTQLGCETIDADVRLILLKYPGNVELVRALKLATEF